MPTSLPAWTLPGLSRDLDGAPWWNGFNSHLGQVIALPDGKAMLAEAADPPPGDRPALRLTGGQSLRAIAVPLSFPFGTQFGADMTVDDLMVLPHAVQTALTAGVAEFILSALRLEALGEVAVAGQGPVADLLPAFSAPRWFKVTIGNVAAEPVAVLLGVEPSVLERCFGVGLVARPIWDGLKGSLTRDVDVTLGRLVLDVAALRGLRDGAVVVMDAVEGVSLRAGAMLFGFRAAGEQWMCDSVKDLDADGPRQEAVTDLSTLEVAVDFDLGRMRVSLAELESWQPGSVVPLPLPEREGVPVTLRANGRPIGTGDLSRIDDRPVVRITQLFFTK